MILIAAPHSTLPEVKGWWWVQRKFLRRGTRSHTCSPLSHSLSRLSLHAPRAYYGARRSAHATPHTRAHCWRICSRMLSRLRLSALSPHTSSSDSSWSPLSLIPARGVLARPGGVGCRGLPWQTLQHRAQAPVEAYSRHSRRVQYVYEFPTNQGSMSDASRALDLVAAS